MALGLVMFLAMFLVISLAGGGGRLVAVPAQPEAQICVYDLQLDLEHAVKGKTCPN